MEQRSEFDRLIGSLDAITAEKRDRLTGLDARRRGTLSVDENLSLRAEAARLREELAAVEEVKENASMSCASSRPC